MDDLISRQDAIDAIKAARVKDDGTYSWRTQRNLVLEFAAELLEALPSAQPLVLTCDGCRHVGTYDTDFPCSGCVRREKDYYEQER